MAVDILKSFPYDGRFVVKYVVSDEIVKKGVVAFASVENGEMRVAEEGDERSGFEGRCEGE